MWAKQRQTGFTIVELLIVIVVIAILAAISIVAYTGIQDRANDSAVEADIQAIIKNMEIAKVDLGHYPQSATEFPDGFKFTKTAYNTTLYNVYYCYDYDNDRYAFGLWSKSGKGYIISAETIFAGVDVNGSETCDAIDKLWVNDDTTLAMNGYNGVTMTWAASWSWTN